MTERRPKDESEDGYEFGRSMLSQGQTRSQVAASARIFVEQGRASYAQGIALALVRDARPKEPTACGICALPDGIGASKTPSDFDENEVAKGILVELEHTTDPDIAMRIVLDHLTENARYYDFLASMEAKMKHPGATPNPGKLSPDQLAAIKNARSAAASKKARPARGAKAASKTATGVADKALVAKLRKVGRDDLLKSAAANGVSLSTAEATKVANLIVDAVVILAKAGMSLEQSTSAICGGPIPNPVKLSSFQQALLNRGRSKMAEMRSAGMTDKQIGEMFDAMHAGMGDGMTLKSNPTKKRSPKTMAEQHAEIDAERAKLDADIAAIVEDKEFIAAVPTGSWGYIKEILTGLLGNDATMLTNSFVRAMKEDRMQDFYVDTRVGLKTVSSGYARGKVTRASVIKAINALKKEKAEMKKQPKRNPASKKPTAPKTAKIAKPVKAKPAKPAKAKAKKAAKANKPPVAAEAAKVTPPKATKAPKTVKAAKPVKPAKVTPAAEPVKAKKAKAAKAPKVKAPKAAKTAKPTKAVKAAKVAKAAPTKGRGRGRPAKVDRAVLVSDISGYKITLSDGRVILLGLDTSEKDAIKAATSRAKEVMFSGEQIKTKAKKAKKAKAAKAAKVAKPTPAPKAAKPAKPAKVAKAKAAKAVKPAKAKKAKPTKARRYALMLIEADGRKLLKGTAGSLSAARKHMAEMVKAGHSMEIVDDAAGGKVIAAKAPKAAKAKKAPKAKSTKTAKVKPAKTTKAKKPSKARTPKAAKPAKAKVAKAPKPTKAKTAKKRWLHIDDPSALAVLTTLEGAQWAAVQEEDKLGPASFWGNKMAFDVLVEGKITRKADVGDVLEGAGAIAGMNGTYLIKRGGEIRLLPGSTTAFIESAERLGIRKL